LRPSAGVPRNLVPYWACLQSFISAGSDEVKQWNCLADDI
jgi:hypothetical protein